MYNPEKNIIISRKDDESIVRTEKLPEIKKDDQSGITIRETYPNQRKPIQINEYDFDILYKQCERLEELEKKTLNLATKLFEKK